MVLFSIFLCLCVSDCFGSLDIYPHPSGMQPSSKFHVKLQQAASDKDHTSFTYMVTSDRRASELEHIVSHRTVSWTSFAFEGEPVTAEITTLTDFHECLVRPKHYGFTCQRTAHKKAKVVITEHTRMMSVEFDYDYGASGNSDIVDKLLIFADAPEHDAPTNLTAEGLWYIREGVHNFSSENMTIAKNISMVYLAPGAYVHGAFRSSGHPGVRIYGRGVLSGENFAHYKTENDDKIKWALVFHKGGRNHVTEGIVLVDPPRFYLKKPGPNNVIRNVKTVAPWGHNSDGVVLGVNGTVEDSFIMANDDSLKVYRDGLTASRCVIWQSHNGAVFQFGWWEERNVHNVRITDIDVIHIDWCAFKGSNCSQLNQNAAVVDLAYEAKDKPEPRLVPARVAISNLEFRNVRIEGQCPRLFYFKIKCHVTGYVSNVSFIDWSVERLSTNPPHANEISGTSTVRFSSWRYHNVKVDNTSTHYPVIFT